MTERVYGYLAHYRASSTSLGGKARPDWIREIRLGRGDYRSQVWIRQRDGSEKEVVLKLASARRERLISDEYLTLRTTSKGYAAPQATWVDIRYQESERRQLHPIPMSGVSRNG
mgnify:FL=1